jgi:LPXTG-site transpeptidase (sortase) family protein
VFENTDENSVIAFDAIVGNLSPGKKITNVATLAWTSLPGDVTDPQSPYNQTSTERYYDPGDPINNYGASSNAQLGTLMADVAKKVLPETWFAPNIVTSLPVQPRNKQYANLGNFWLEIPKLDVSIPIVGVPLTEDGWDLTWLGANAGWLEGTAYPTHEGNAALTSHVTLADGTDGPFANLDELQYGDKIIIHMDGNRYVYEIRLMRQIYPNNLYILRHQNYPWLTLLTCKDYNAYSDSYLYRYSVGAVLIQVEDE